MKEAYQIIIQIDRDKLTKNEVMDLLQIKYPEAKDIKRIKDFRTQQQNNALHLWFAQLSQEFNEKHITVKHLFEGEALEVEFTPEIVKEMLWKRSQKGAFGKTSTTELFKSGDIDFIYDAINRFVSDKFRGEVVVPNFPSQEFLREQEC